MNHTTTTNTAPLFNSKVYDSLKWVALIGLPAFSAAYFSLSDIWNLPYAFEVVGTATVLDTLLGTILGISNHNYKKNDSRFDGSVMVDTSNPNKDVLTINFKQPAEELTELDSVELKIEEPPTSNTPPS